jgi:methyl-accepting chemotaxis protein
MKEWLRTIRLRMSLRGQLVAVLSGVVAILVFFLMSFFPGQMSALSQDWVRRRATGMSTVLAKATTPGVEFDDANNIAELLNEMSTTPGVMYAAMERGDGSTLAKWYHDPSTVIPAQNARPQEPTFELNGLLHVQTPIATKGGARAILLMGFSLQELEEENRKNVVAVTVFCAFVLILGVSLSFVMGTMLARPIRHVSEVALQIAEGDLQSAERALGGRERVALTASLYDSNSNDRNEVRHLRSSFAKMLIALTETSATLQESAALLTNSVNNLSASASEQSETIMKQAGALDQTRVIAEVIRQISVTTAQKAQEVLAVAERADEISRSGEATIQRSIGGMSEMRDKVHDIARHISLLAERSNEIGQITSTVKNFADQSNMLAINAALVAVRSGEYGRGFGIVAREIRSLADRSVKATEQVRDLLGVMVDETQKTFTISEEGALNIDKGLDQIKASGQSIRDLAEIVKSNCGAVRQIAAAVNQQNSGVGQLFGAVKDLSSMMDSTVKQIENTNRAVQIVKEVSKRVADAAKRYQV